jgi:alpha-1,2-rhamnosyltransferase
MCEDIVLRLKLHSENGKRLFWFNNADDDELEFAYQNADALIFASFVEGFGLPLVEGLQRGLPAIASDIPVFREVAGDFAEFFDPNSASDLCAIIDQFSISKKLPSARPVAEWKWITWKESAQQLFDAVDRCCRELDERRSVSNAHQH